MSFSEPRQVEETIKTQMSEHVHNLIVACTVRIEGAHKDYYVINRQRACVQSNLDIFSYGKLYWENRL